jgi:hypothetical protein
MANIGPNRRSNNSTTPYESVLCRQSWLYLHQTAKATKKNGVQGVPGSNPGVPTNIFLKNQ